MHHPFMQCININQNQEALICLLTFKTLKYMRRIFLFLAIFIFGQTLFAQINLDSIWQKQVVERYTKMDNYKFSITTNSTIRGKFYGGVRIDTLRNVKDSSIFYIERQNGKISFMSFEDEDVMSYTQNNINTTVDYLMECITINPLDIFQGEYLNDKYFFWKIQYSRFLTDRGQGFKKIDGIYDDGKYFVFECIDSSTIVNDTIIKVENIKMFVNKETNLVEKITAKLQNSRKEDVMVLGALAREINIQYLEINSENSAYKTKFNTDNFKDFLVVKNKFYWENDVKAQEKINAKLANRVTDLPEKMLNTEIKNLQGNITTFNNLKGWILVDTWNSGCGYCAQLMKDNAKNHSQFEKRDVEIISINPIEQPNKYVTAFCEKQGLNLKELYFVKDENKQDEFKTMAKYFPTIYLISPDKKIIFQSFGYNKTKDILSKIDKAIFNYNKNKKQ